MNCYKYGYLLTISDDEGMLCKYDYLSTDELLFNNSAVYDYLSGIDLCCYDLNDKKDNEDFFDNIVVLNADYKVDRITILLDLDKSIKEFLEV